MYEMRFAAADMARVRFAVSPLWEVAEAVRCLIDPRQMAYHLPWLDTVRPTLADLDLGPLVAVQPLRGYTPDFLSPMPPSARTTIDEQLRQVYGVLRFQAKPSVYGIVYQKLGLAARLRSPRVRRPKGMSC